MKSRSKKLHLAYKMAKNFIIFTLLTGFLGRILKTYILLLSKIC